MKRKDETDEEREIFRKAMDRVESADYVILHFSTVIALVLGLLMGIITMNAATGTYTQISHLIFFGGAAYFANRPRHLIKRHGQAFSRVLQIVGTAIVAYWFYPYLMEAFIK